MKTLILTLTLIFTLTAAVSQNIPEIAQNTFDKEFNTNNEATDIVWTKSGDNFVVYFEYNGKKRSVLFDADGHYKENRTFISFKRLNENAAAYLTANYSKKSIVQCYEVMSNTAPERNEIEIEINGELSTLYFRPNGEFHYKK